MVPCHRKTRKTANNEKQKINERPMGVDVLLKNQLGHGSKFQKLHIHSLSNSGRRNWAYIRSMGSDFRDNGWFSKLPYLTMKYSLSNPAARNWAHSRSTDSGFRDTGRFSKLSYLGRNSKKLHIYSLSIPRGWNWACFALRAAISKIRANFQKCHIWAWNLASGQIWQFCKWACISETAARSYLEWK